MPSPAKMLLPLLSLLLTLAAATPHYQTDITAQELISLLSLQPSSERGYFYETFRDTYHVPCASNRSASTAIYYLLTGDESPSLWHRVDEAEVWHYYAGAPLSLYIADDDGGSRKEITMGTDLVGGMRPQGVVPKNMWQRARSWGEWTLVGTTGELVHFHL